MALFCECSRTTWEALRGRCIQTLTEKSIAIQNKRGQGYYRIAKDDNGSKNMINLKILKCVSLLFYYCPDKCVSLVL